MYQKLKKNLPAIILILLITSAVITRRHIFFFVPTLGYFNDWTVIELSLFDLILIFSSISFFIFKQYQKKQGRDFYCNSNPQASLFEKTDFTSAKKLLTKKTCRRVLFLFALWILVDAILISHSNSFGAKILNLFYAWQIIKIYLALWLCGNLTGPRPERGRNYDGVWQKSNLKIPNTKYQIPKIITRSLIFLSIFESMVALGQFFFQSNLGLSFLGEEFFDPNTNNVAKIETAAGLKFIRGYGTFSHPNILAFFLLLGVLACLIERRLHTVKSAAMAATTPSTVWPNLFYSIGLSLNLIGLILTFSRSAWLTLIISLIIFFTISSWAIIKKILLNRSAKISFRGLKIKSQFSLPVLITLAVGLLSVFLVSDLITARVSVVNQKEVSNLNFRVASLTNFIPNNYRTLVFGDYEHQAVLEYQKGPEQTAKKTSLASWQIQPPANLYWLILVQWGIVGLVIFLLFVRSVIKNCLLLNNYQVINNYLTTTSNTPKKITFLILSFVLGIFLITANLDHFLLSLAEGVNLFIVFLLLISY